MSVCCVLLHFCSCRRVHDACGAISSSNIYIPQQQLPHTKTHPPTSAYTKQTTHAWRLDVVAVAVARRVHSFAFV